MTAAVQRKDEIKYKLDHSKNSDTCTNLPYWDYVAPAGPEQENFASVTPQLLWSLLLWRVLLYWQG